MAQKSLKKLLLSLSITAALGAGMSGSALAGGDDVAALEARIAELESLVHQLMQDKPAPAPSSADVEAKAEQAAEAKVVAMMGEHEKATAEKVHKHSYKFGGFVKTDVMFTDYGSGSYSGAGRDFYIPGTTPVGDGDGESYLDFHAKESRINFKTTHNLDNGAKIGTFLEMDFQLPAGGNERVEHSWRWTSNCPPVVMNVYPIRSRPASAMPL
jgi:hypothetical protein